MAKQLITEQVAHRWYTRPVLFVADVERALDFYIGLLGFKKSWHDGGGGKVCQVSRAGCEIILCEDGGRKGRARLFVALTGGGLAQLRREIVEHSIPHKEVWWGYDAIQIDDPDGNELLFPVPNG
jgi:catechol 2,3-dioxygenase-like lactoylglutathione lyase family enzyme